MKKILRFRELTLKQLRFARLLKPFEDAQLVVDVPKDPNMTISLVWDLCHDEQDHFDQFLITPDYLITPSDLYQMIEMRHPRIPSLAVVDETSSGYRRIRAIRSYNELQLELEIASGRGWVQPLRKGGKK